MPAAKVSDEVLFAKLLSVFRQQGYEGASLSQLSQATGLEKASLYHRFPGGKEEMADALLGHADRWFQANVVAPLAAPGDPAAKLRKTLQALKEFYAAGLLCCLLDTLSVPPPSPRLREHLQATLTVWLDSFAHLARHAGYSAAEARHRAEEAVAGLEGALILSRIQQEEKPFLRALERVPDLLLPSS
jgi:TetR/AcrR family transcriptional regulator, lmrAB and yxaGH operons repressor